ncbi:MAG: hypothetical protein HONDAALG_00022 [Gammaproteobacteria bacterium]|nr:hypothetical protein [Gammaproteobacteria bacterium]
MAGRADAEHAGVRVMEAVRLTELAIAKQGATTRCAYLPVRSAESTCLGRAAQEAVTPATTRCDYIHLRSAAAFLQPRVAARITTPCPNVLDRVERACDKAATIVCGRDTSSVQRALMRALAGFDAVRPRGRGGAAIGGSRATRGAVTPATTRCEYIHVRSAAASLRPRVVARITAPCPNVLDRFERACVGCATFVFGGDTANAQSARRRSPSGFDSLGPRGLRRAATLGRRDAAAEPTGTYLRRVAALRRPLGPRGRYWSVA